MWPRLRREDWSGVLKEGGICVGHWGISDMQKWQEGPKCFILGTWVYMFTDSHSVLSEAMSRFAGEGNGARPLP